MQFAGRRIVVVGINYAPETTGIAPYTTDLCEFLVAQGASVVAVTGIPHYPHWTVPADLRTTWSKTEIINGVKVIRARHFVPASQSALKRGLYEASFFANASLVARELAPDLVIAVTPALGGAWAGARIAARSGAPLAVIVQDLMGRAARQSGIGGGGNVSALVDQLELKALRRATSVAVISPCFRTALINDGVDGHRIVDLPNHTHITASPLGRDDARDALGWPKDRFIALHTGNMGLKQDLGNVVEAARFADEHGDDHIHYILMGSGSQEHQLREQGRGIPTLTFAEPLDQEMYPHALAAADVLLVNERATVTDMSLPSKLTSYFAAGRAVVGAVPIGGATHGAIAASGGGVSVPAGMPKELHRQIAELHICRDQLDDLGAAGRRYATMTLGHAAAMDRTASWLLSLSQRQKVPALV